MPATSEAQRKAAGAALAVSRGQAPKSSLKGASLGMLKSMSGSQLADFASKPRTTREVIGKHPGASSHKSVHRSGHKSEHRKRRKSL